MACPKHVVNCPDRLVKKTSTEKPVVLTPTTTIIGGKTYIVKPKSKP